MKLLRTKFYRAMVHCIALTLCGVSVPASAQVMQWFERALSGGRINELHASNDTPGRSPRDESPADDRRMMPDEAGVDNQSRDGRGRMSPEDRQQLRRDIRDAGRDIYPERPRRHKQGGKGRRSGQD
ncbi:MAG: hypothetical protein WA112_10655 [Rugosibacter sp.]|jgi:hypothetical protein|nr:hypothetical protein [Rugosibacter sp.]